MKFLVLILACLTLVVANSCQTCMDNYRNCSYNKTQRADICPCANSTFNCLVETNCTDARDFAYIETIRHKYQCNIFDTEENTCLSNYRNCSRGTYEGNNDFCTCTQNYYDCVGKNDILGIVDKICQVKGCKWCR